MELDQVYSLFCSLLSIADGSEVHHGIYKQVLRTKQE